MINRQFRHPLPLRQQRGYIEQIRQLRGKETNNKKKNQLYQDKQLVFFCPLQALAPPVTGDAAGLKSLSSCNQRNNTAETKQQERNKRQPMLT